MFDFVTIGTGTRDIFFRVTEGKVLSGPPAGSASPLYLGFEYGAKIVTNDAAFSYGGGALNTALALAKMDLNVAAAFRIGSEGTGDVLLEEMAKRHVDHRYVERDRTLHTGLSFVITVPGADHVLFHYPGAGAGLTIDNLAGIDTRWLYLTSLIGASTELLPQIEAKVLADSIQLVLNPGATQIAAGYPALRGLIAAAHVLIVNRREAAELVHSADASAATGMIPDLLGSMRGWGARHVVITDGAAGVYAATGDRIYFMPAYPARVIDTTGAGDAFGAAYVAGLVHTAGDVAEALRLASANAASVVANDGAHAGSLTVAAAEQLAARYKDIKVKTLV